jgi:phytanoyl-CoA hydroxylase
MRHSLTDEQIRRFRQDGFLVYEDLLARDELEDLRRGVDRALAQFGSRKMLDGADWRDTDDYAGRIFVQRFNLWRLEPVVRRYLQGPEVGELAGRLAGVDALRTYYDQSLQKAPWANPTGFHFDNPYWSFHHPQAIVCWVALDDATLQNGCLYYLPGSHRLPEQRNAGFAKDVGAVFTEHPELKDVEPAPAVMRAGSCVFHNGRTAHAAGANMTPRWRRAMSTFFVPDGAVFNGQQDVMSDEEFRRLKVGDRISDDERHPLVWRAPVAAG